MSVHAKFEELCVLATSGQLTVAEARTLDAHLRECVDCRRFLIDARLVSDVVVPRVLPVFAVESKVPAGMRARFLARTQAEGLRIHAGPPFAAPQVPAGIEPQVAATGPTTGLGGMRALHSGTRLMWSRLMWSKLVEYWQRVALATCACAMCFALGTMLRLHDGRPVNSAADHPMAANPNPQPTVSSSASDDKDTLLSAIRELSADRNSLAKQRTQLASELESVNKAKRDTEAALQAKISSLDSNAAHDHQSLTQQMAALSDRAQALQWQLAELQQKQTETEAMLVDQEKATRKYSSQVGQLEEQLATQSRIPAINGDEVRSLVAARNLHIIDVYDSDGVGNRQPAFGRVFYVEGRSLVFYAYDLRNAHAEKAITFHVWGAHANGKETTISLGVLHREDPGDQRWAMTYDDPKVLAKINSLFVTVEPGNRDATSPTGKKVLYAFLGEKPNHP